MISIRDTESAVFYDVVLSSTARMSADYSIHGGHRKEYQVSLPVSIYAKSGFVTCPNPVAPGTLWRQRSLDTVFLTYN